jgi:hypothetical protein
MMMKWSRLITPAFVLSTIFFFGCGSSKQVSSEPERIGSAECTRTCHATTTDITGTPIAQAWAESAHTTDGGVQCEDCHGGGSLHRGVGPIPYPNPQAAQCNACHDKTGFDGTIHANPRPYDGTNAATFSGPDKFFFSGDADGGQASIMGVPEFLPDGVTPVTHARHIEECSRCHNPNQRFVFDVNGILIKPSPEAMPTPVVSCASCHDAHQVERKVTIAQRSDPVAYPVFRKFFTNPTGEQNDNIPGTQAAASIYQPNGAVQPDGSVDASKVVGTNNELHLELLCAACHTKGKYKYSQLTTHQENVYPQWKNSGHGKRNAPPFAEFSANPPAYINAATGLPFDAGSHQVSYPFDMALNAAGATADTTRNAGNNNFQCYKCHNGLASLAWQGNVQGTPDAPVVFGDEPVTCVTCHDPHEEHPAACNDDQLFDGLRHDHGQRVSGYAAGPGILRKRHYLHLLPPRTGERLYIV